GTISYTNEAGKIYQLKPDPAVLICRVRGLHLPEKHVTWRGEADSDFRLRIQQAFEGMSVAGSTGAYEFHGRSADGRVADISVI
ncbi:hypothetical protein ONN26_25520, partial [Salmonella enterica subsp. enterica serovar Muenster]|nr:hypothetical protein [Salmonella enterica subsp. enterica serovar Muenster]